MDEPPPTGPGSTVFLEDSQRAVEHSLISIGPGAIEDDIGCAGAALQRKHWQHLIPCLACGYRDIHYNMLRA